MIRDLTQALVQPLETSERPPEPEPEPELELLLVMEEEQQRKKEEAEQEVLKSPLALHGVFEGDSDQESFHGFQND